MSTICQSILATPLDRNAQSICDEAQWYDYWAERKYNQLDPASMALAAGMHSPDLSCVFISGYQAAVRCVFPEAPMNGWAAFAASEDTRNPKENPPLLAEISSNSIVLTGCKSWVAQSEHVDHLIVTANHGNEEPITLIADRHAKNICISHRESPSFLPGMSQGFAQFNALKLTKDSIIADNRVKTFMKNESKFIMLALCGWFYSQTQNQHPELAQSFAKLCEAYYDACNNPDVKVYELAELDTRLQHAFKQFERKANTSIFKNWQADRGLVGMYSKGLQARAKQ